MSGAPLCSVCFVRIMHNNMILQDARGQFEGSGIAPTGAYTSPAGGLMYFCVAAGL